MECLVRWSGPSGMSFIAETGSGHLVAMDGAPDAGGRNLAARPMELVLAGTGEKQPFSAMLLMRPEPALGSGSIGRDFGAPHAG